MGNGAHLLLVGKVCDPLHRGSWPDLKLTETAVGNGLQSNKGERRKKTQFRVSEVHVFGCTPSRSHYPSSLSGTSSRSLLARWGRAMVMWHQAASAHVLQLSHYAVNDSFPLPPLKTHKSNMTKVLKKIVLFSGRGVSWCPLCLFPRN